MPFSSEVAFIGAIEGGMPKIYALIFASVGNVLAIILNYFLGYYFWEKTHLKLECSSIGKKSLQYGKEYGYYALLLSWLPIIGDPLTLVAGIVRLKFVWFVIVAGSFRVVRYVLLAYIL